MFITAVAGDKDEMPLCEWIFNLIKLRSIFMENIDYEEY